MARNDVVVGVGSVVDDDLPHNPLNGSLVLSLLYEFLLNNEE
jgi:hypothetical protein